MFIFLCYDASSLPTFLLELLLLYVCTTLLSLPYWVGIPLSFSASSLVQYLLCHWWVFPRSGRSIAVEYGYFMSVVLAGLVWVFLLVAIFVQVFGAPVLMARLLASVFTGLWNFYLNARLSFRSRAFIKR